MSALENPKSSWTLPKLKTQEELESFQMKDEVAPDLFDLLLENESYEIVCAAPQPLKKKGKKGCRCNKTRCLQMYC